MAEAKLFLAVSLILASCNVLQVFSQTPIHPCDPNSGESVVYLPQDGLCLIPISNKKSWLAAQADCEADLGSLYRLKDGRLMGGSTGGSVRLGQCLSAMPSSSLVDSDFWVGVVSNYTRQWFWVNNTLLNPIRYTTTDKSAFELKDSVEMCSNYLSVDFCVAECHSLAAAYTVLHWQKSYPCCFCSFRVDFTKVQMINQTRFNAQPRTSTYYVAQAGEGIGNLIRLKSSEAFLETDTLCATVDTTTSTTRELTSKTCFSEFPFICSLGTNPSVSCDNMNCQNNKCRLRVRDECVQRDSRPMTWFRAREECILAGGDLWTVGKLDDMHQVHLALKDATLYWVGAVNHNWSFTAESDIFGSVNPDYQVFRCGHMFMEMSGGTVQTWKWSDTRCDQQKAYVCQYTQTIHTSATTNNEVICPWVIPSTAAPVTDPASVTTAKPPTNGTVVTEGPVYAAGSDYPVIPIIAAAIAAFAILMCAIFVLGYSRRRNWLLKKMRQTREYVWPFWASTPTYLAPSHGSDPGFDSLSTGHTGVHSDNGSVFVYPDIGEGGDRSHAQRGVLRATRGASFASGASRRAGSSTANGGPGGGEGGREGGGATGGAGEGGGVDAGVNPVYDNASGMMSAYRPTSPRSREYMTLTAHMNVRDDYENLNPSTRRKPEVALVTSDVDLNFTVNHAYPRAPRRDSEMGENRGVDEIDLPQDSTVQIPTRAVEESLMHF